MSEHIYSDPMLRHSDRMRLLCNHPSHGGYPVVVGTFSKNYRQDDVDVATGIHEAVHDNVFNSALRYDNGI